jgi:hypothetical protein
MAASTSLNTVVTIPNPLDLSLLGDYCAPIMSGKLSKMSSEANGLNIISAWNSAAAAVLNDFKSMPKPILASNLVMLRMREQIFLLFYTDQDLGKKAWNEYQVKADTWQFLWPTANILVSRL